MRGRTPTTARDAAAEDRLGVDDDWEEGADEWSKSLAAIDAAVARSEKVLAGETVERRPSAERPSLVYDPEWDEDVRLAEWHGVVEATRTLPSTLAAAIALDAWNEIEPLQNQPWLGRLLAAEVLRSRGKTRTHLACLNVGLKATPQEMRWKRDPVAKIAVSLEALGAAAEEGLKRHDRLILAKLQLDRKTQGRRSSSRLPALAELMLEIPTASAGLIADRLGVTPRAAITLACELGLRETTGRTRYRAWSIG